MKVENTLAICKGFAMCRGHITANDTYEYSLEDVYADGRFSQIFYLLDGGGIMYDEEGNEYRRSHLRSIYNLKDFYGKKYKFVAGDRGATWLCINPIPANKFFNIDTLREDTIIHGDMREQNIICSRGTITVNGKDLKQFNYARILNGKVANIAIPSDSEALYITR